MANVLHLMIDRECEDFFRMNMNKSCTLFHLKWFQHSRTLFDRNVHSFHTMHSILMNLFDYNVDLFRKFTFDELTMVAKEI